MFDSPLTEVPIGLVSATACYRSGFGLSVRYGCYLSDELSARYCEALSAMFRDVELRRRMLSLVVNGRWMQLLVGMTIGLVVLFVGVMLMTNWEVEQFRATTFDRDFTGLVCGVPLSNPGWQTGSPCHGAVNRQTGFALMLTGVGLVSLFGSTAMAIGRIRNSD